MHYLITGGAGFIGSHVAEQLLLEGHCVTVVDNFTTGNIQNLPGHPKLQRISKDILDCHAKDLKDKFDGIAHLAATPSVAEAWQKPLATHHNNISTTVAVLELCQALQIPRLVFTSSAAVYGNPIQVPIPENHPTAPISPYGLHKLVGEQYVNLFSQQFGQQFGWSAVNLRLFNVFGPRQDPHSPYSGVISIFAKAMQSEQPIVINGDGTQTRDFIFVKDVASAFVKALTIPLEPGTSITCNIGTGKAISLLALKETLQLCFPNWNSTTKFTESRLGDIQHSQADISLARRYLEFSPEWSIQKGLHDLNIAVP